MNFGAIGQIMKMLIVLSVETGRGKINFGLNGSHIEWGPIIFASLYGAFCFVSKLLKSPKSRKSAKIETDIN